MFDDLYQVGDLVAVTYDDLYQLTGRLDMAMAAAFCLASSGFAQGRPLYLYVPIFTIPIHP